MSYIAPQMKEKFETLSANLKNDILKIKGGIKCCIRGDAKVQKTIKRFLLFLIGINLLAIGIILNTRSDLGVAAFTSFFYALSKITGISLGNSSIIV